MKIGYRPPNPALVALACGVVVTLLAWYLVGRSVDREARAEFTNQADLAAGVIERRMQRYIDLLFGLEALTSHDPKFTRQDFADYVAALDVERRFPGIKAIQYVRRQADPERWVITMRRDEL